MKTRPKSLLAATILFSALVLASSLWVSTQSSGEVEPSLPESLDAYSPGKKHRTQWRLPAALHEVSGIAVVDNRTILIHNDELAITFAFDRETGGVSRHFQLGDPALKEDLEGIARIGINIFLVSSGGKIYRISNGVGRTGIIDDYQVFNTGLEDICEIEGLAPDLKAGGLVLACKRMYDKDADFLSVFRFDLVSQEVTKLFDIPFAWFDKKLRFTAISTQFGGYVMLAGKERLLIQVNSAGEFITSLQMKKKRHHQPEGLGFFPSGALVVADEGKEDKGKITIYETGDHYRAN